MSIHATFIGRLGRDPELKTIPSGKQVCNVSVATDHGYGDRKSTTWVRCAVWGKRGEAFSRFLGKGDSVLITGTVYTREHDGKTYVECDVSDWEFCGGKSERPPTRGTQSSHDTSPPPPTQPAAESNIPF